MAARRIKCGIFTSDGKEVPYERTRMFETQVTMGSARMVVTAEEGMVNILSQLVMHLKGPFHILYVLVIPNDHVQAGRYEMQNAMTWEQLEHFLLDNCQFLEEDGRHHLWITSEQDNAALIYDQHDVISIYGPLPSFEGILREMGFNPGRVDVQEQTHSHHHHEDHDASLEKMLSSFSWNVSPLEAGDDEIA